MYSEECIETFLKKQEQLFDEPVAETYEEAEEFLSEREILNDPALLPDMEKAVSRVSLAVEQGEKICVYGDSCVLQGNVVSFIQLGRK